MSTTGRGRGTGEEEPPVAPPIPSFASLRAPGRRHPAMDVLAPPPVSPAPGAPAELPFPAEPPAEGEPARRADGPAPVAGGPAPARRPAPPSWPAPASGPIPASWPAPASWAAPVPRRGPAPRPAPAAAPRPAEWPDLLRFGMQAATAALRLPGVLVREPARRLRRLLGE